MVVSVQTRLPAHHAVRCAVDHDYETFVRLELDGRRHPAYPPENRLANIIFSGTTEDAASQLAMEAGEWLGKLLEHRLPLQAVGTTLM